MELQDSWDVRCLVSALEDDQATARARAGRTTGLDGEMTIASLPTVYRGTTFRSALEASWAATLESLGITWEYEPKTVTLPSGERYIPDFHLPEIDTWMEVKGPGVPRVEKAYAFSQTLACDCPDGCDHRWPRGELVPIGLEPRAFNPWAEEDYDHWPTWSKNKLAWRHGGFARWKSTRSRRAWLTRCLSCKKASWFDTPDCRACGRRLSGAHGVQSGSDDIQFIPIRGTRPTADVDDLEEEAA
jgi:hypothetical protein